MAALRAAHGRKYSQKLLTVLRAFTGLYGAIKKKPAMMAGVV